MQPLAPRIVRIVSGGQTGVDRAALDAAIAAGVPYSGWCPEDGWAEDFPEPPGLLAAYPCLRETTSRLPAARTRLNVRDSDATLVVRPEGTGSRGTVLTVLIAGVLRRPHLVTTGAADEQERVGSWLAGLGDGVTLNVAGPRESECPGVYRLTRTMLSAVGLRG